ncbi:hypothetical protein [Streptomyces sp. ODS28]|uniref:peptidoglycan binding domain-containing protein n=1 Tax=Streptomyces sp. ODS28 TaxID=3136688 RepID=UPI0031E6F93E
MSESEEPDSAGAAERGGEAPGAPASPAETTGQHGTVPPPAPAGPAAEEPQPGDPGREQGGGSGEFTQETSDWFAPRRKGAKNPPTSGGGAASGASGATGASGAAAAGQTSGGRTDLPYFSGGQDARPDAYDTGPIPAGHPSPPDTPADGTPRSAIHNLMDGTGETPAAGSTGPAGPTSGPGTGDMPFSKPGEQTGGHGTLGGGIAGGAPTGPHSDPYGTQENALPEPPPYAGPYAADPAPDSTLGLGAGPAPFAPGGVGEELLNESGLGMPPGTGGPGTGAPGTDAPGSAPPGPNPPGDDRIASDTLVSGIPRVPSGSGAESTGGTGIPGAPGLGSPPVPERPDVSTPASEPAPAASPAGSGGSDGGSGGGRSKLMLAGAGLVGLIGIAYGAGLLLDHSDVPNGTTVLGVDIGGTSKHEAVNKLDTALGDNKNQAFTVTAADHKSSLRPSVAGLTLDTEETVRKAAGRDYNPVSVIGSLFGVDREAQPAISVDREKMKSALARISRQSGGGAPTDGEIKFVAGRAVAVPGKPHKGIDPDKASDRLQKAYRDRAITGRNSPVALPVSMQQPEVGKAELDRAMREFAKPAMSGMVTVKAGNAEIKFSPEKSLPKFLSMKPVNGKLMDSYKLPVLQKLYGTTFANVKIARGNGSRTPVMPQDVVQALRPALKQTDPAKRVAEIPLNPS